MQKKDKFKFTEEVLSCSVHILDRNNYLIDMNYGYLFSGGLKIHILLFTSPNISKSISVTYSLLHIFRFVVLIGPKISTFRLIALK